MYSVCSVQDHKMQQAINWRPSVLNICKHIVINAKGAHDLYIL